MEKTNLHDCKTKSNSALGTKKKKKKNRPDDTVVSGTFIRMSIANKSPDPACRTGGAGRSPGERTPEPERLRASRTAGAEDARAGGRLARAVY